MKEEPKKGDFPNLRPDDVSPRIEVEVNVTRYEFTQFTRALDGVDSIDDLIGVLAFHVGKEFPEVARKHAFGLVVVNGPVKCRWRMLD